MKIEACRVPAASVVGSHAIDGAYFSDAYRAPVQNEQASVVDIFFSIFGHLPLWMKRALITRNWLAGACGLEVPTREEIMKPMAKSDYNLGDKIGPWPIFALTDTELVAGRDNKHLDFRLSVFREKSALGTNAVISTICTTHNTFGKLYILFIAPFHKWGVKWLIAKAVTSGRL